MMMIGIESHLPLGGNAYVIPSGNVEPHVSCTSRLAVKQAWQGWVLSSRPQMAFTPTFKMSENGIPITRENVDATVRTFANGLSKKLYERAQIKKKMRVKVFLKEEGAMSSLPHKCERYHGHGVIANIPERYDLTKTSDQQEVENIVRRMWLSRPYTYNNMHMKFLIENEDYEYNAGRWLMYAFKKFDRDASDGIYINLPKG